jgi:hypothetical protein
MRGPQSPNNFSEKTLRSGAALSHTARCRCQLHRQPSFYSLNLDWVATGRGLADLSPKMGVGGRGATTRKSGDPRPIGQLSP